MKTIDDGDNARPMTTDILLIATSVSSVNDQARLMSMTIVAVYSLRMYDDSLAEEDN